MASEIIEKQATILDACFNKIEELKNNPDVELNVDVVLALYAEVNKDLRMKEIAQERKNNNNHNELATWKQKNYMRALKIGFPEDITKEEATKLIENKLNEVK